MLLSEYPKTKEGACAYRYNAWSGNPKGYTYNNTCCAAEAIDGWLPRQCVRKPGKGPGGLYCGIHARKLAKYEEQQNGKV